MIVRGSRTAEWAGRNTGSACGAAPRIGDYGLFTVIVQRKGDDPLRTGCHATATAGTAPHAMERELSALRHRRTGPVVSTL